MSSDDDIMSQFAAMQQRNDVAEVVKELFDDKKIFLITDLSRDEVCLLTRIWTIAQIKNIEIYKQACLFYAQIVLSGRRKSRTEILDAIRGMTGGLARQSRGLFGNRNQGGQFPDERFR